MLIGGDFNARTEENVRMYGGKEKEVIIGAIKRGSHC